MTNTATRLATTALISFTLIGCGGGDGSNEVADTQPERESAMTPISPDEVERLAANAAPNSSQNQPVTPAERQCGLRVPSTDEYSYNQRVPPYVNASYDESLADVDDPCLLTAADMNVLGSSDRLAMKLLHDEPELLQDQTIQYTLACLHDPIVSESVKDNEFAWPRLAETVVERTKTLLPQFASLEFDVPLGSKQSLSKYDAAAGGFHIVSGGRDPNIGQIGMPLPYFAGCVGRAPYSFSGDIENWYETGNYEQFTIELDRPISDLFVKMTPAEAENFITQQIKNDRRSVSMTATVRVDDYTRSDKSTVFIRVTFKGKLKAVTVTHPDIDTPIISNTYE